MIRGGTHGGHVTRSRLWSPGSGAPWPPWRAASGGCEGGWRTGTRAAASGPPLCISPAEGQRQHGPVCVCVCVCVCVWGGGPGSAAGTPGGRAGCPESPGESSTERRRLLSSLLLDICSGTREASAPAAGSPARLAPPGWPRCSPGSAAQTRPSQTGSRTLLRAESRSSDTNVFVLLLCICSAKESASVSLAGWLSAAAWARFSAIPSAVLNDADEELPLKDPARHAHGASGERAGQVLRAQLSSRADPIGCSWRQQEGVACALPGSAHLSAGVGQSGVRAAGHAPSPSPLYLTWKEAPAPGQAPAPRLSSGRTYVTQQLAGVSGVLCFHGYGHAGVRARAQRLLPRLLVPEL